MVEATEERDLAAPKEIVDPMERFESNLASYQTGHCKETQVRREFVYRKAFYEGTCARLGFCSLMTHG